MKTKATGWDALNELAETVKKPGDKHYRFRFGKTDRDPRVIIFLDGDDPPVVLEHEIWYARKLRGRTVCLGNGCPVCAAGDTPRARGAVTILDRTEWTDRNGNKHANTIRPFVVEAWEFQRIKEYMESQNRPWAGQEWRVKRTGEKQSPLGDVWIHIKNHDIDEIKKSMGDAFQILPYAEEVFVTLSREDAVELAKWVKNEDETPTEEAASKEASSGGLVPF